MPTHDEGCRIAGPITIESLEEKIFLDRPGVLVTNAMFSVSPGASYPIRNISSVSIVRDPPRWISWILAVVITVNAFMLMGFNPTVGFGIILLSIPFWYRALNRCYQLRIGAGGILQVAIGSRSASTLQEVADAVNGAILYMQKVT